MEPKPVFEALWNPEGGFHFGSDRRFKRSSSIGTNAPEWTAPRDSQQLAAAWPH